MFKMQRLRGKAHSIKVYDLELKKLEQAIQKTKPTKHKEASSFVAPGRSELEKLEKK